MRLFILFFFLSFAFAHEILYEVNVQRAVVMRVFFADGQNVPYALYEIYSPADPKIPYQKGRTDRRGYLSFIPDRSGEWRVKVVENSGHGLDVKIKVEEDLTVKGNSGRSEQTLRLVGGLIALFFAFLILRALRRR